MRNLRMPRPQNIWLLSALVKELQLPQKRLVAGLAGIAHDKAERFFGHVYCGKPMKPVSVTVCKLAFCYDIALALVDGLCGIVGKHNESDV